MVRFTASSTLSAALSDPDVQLMLRVRADDPEAFDELYRRYHLRVRAVITHLMGNRESSEDLAQEVFLRVYRARHQYVVGAKFSTWLFTIVNNVVLNARRTLGRRREVHVAFAEGERGCWEELWHDRRVGSPPQVAERRELREIVQDGVRQLGRRQRDAVSLCDLAEMTYADVASQMGTTPDAAKSLIHRGRMKLKKKLAPSVRSGDIV